MSASESDIVECVRAGQASLVLRKTCERCVVGTDLPIGRDSIGTSSGDDAGGGGNGDRLQAAGIYCRALRCSVRLAACRSRTAAGNAGHWVPPYHVGRRGDAILTAFRQGLKEVGFVENKNVAIEYRWADNQLGRLPALAADLVGRNVAVIAATGGGSSVLAARRRPRQPIVFTTGGDPVMDGLVASLNGWKETSQA